MGNQIFFAWQSDIDEAINRSLIWQSINLVCKKLSEEHPPEQSPRPERDTQGISGSPNIAQTIFNKIDQCSVLIADVTFVGKTSNNKHIPNPNVLLELGYAAKTIGWERTILVLNKAYGDAEELPFDFRQHRWPIKYEILNSKAPDIAIQTQQLTEDLYSAVSSCLDYSLSRAVDMMHSLDADSFQIVALNEGKTFIDMPSPVLTYGIAIKSILYGAAYRRLIDLGAIQVVDEPHVGYGWTSDGLSMIKEINKTHPGLLQRLRDTSNKESEA